MIDVGALTRTFGFTVLMSEFESLGDYMTKTWTQAWSTSKDVEIQNFPSIIERKKCKRLGNRNIRNNKPVFPNVGKIEHRNQRTGFAYE